jgi:uncharacterized membrane protein YfcA
MYLYGLSAWDSTAHSLIIVGSTALLGAFMAHKRQELDLKKALLFGFPGLAGVFTVRAWVIPLIPPSIPLGDANSFDRGLLVLGVFVLLMLASSWSMISSSSSKAAPPATSSHAEPQSWILLIRGFVLGSVTGFVGAGGGFLIIPALIKFAKLPMRLAVGTSLGIIALNSLVGVLGEFKNFNSLQIKLLLLVSGLSTVGMLIGTKLRSKIPQESLKKIFGYFVLVMGLWIIWQEFMKR